VAETVEFRVLGPLDFLDEVAVQVPAGKQRVLLASLLVRANRVVPFDVLAAHLWDDALPGGPRATLQSYVMRLRRVLGPVGDALVTHPHGYALQVDDDAVDARRFAAANPGFPLAELADELHDPPSRLDALDTGEVTASLRAVFATSYQALGSGSAELFRALGLAPSPAMSLPALASLAGIQPARARMLAADLERAHLLSQFAPRRYRAHDPVHLYAVDRARHEIPPDEQTAAQRRLIDHYLHTAAGAHRAGEPRLSPIVLPALSSGAHVLPIRDEDEALAWFDTEYRSLLTALALARNPELPGHVWGLAWALGWYQWRRGVTQEHLDVCRAGVAATQRLADRVSEGLARRALGLALGRAAQHDQASVELHSALAISGAAGDITNQAHSLNALAQSCVMRKDFAGALDHARHALRLYREVPAPAFEASALNAVGWCHALLGEYGAARDHCEQALAAHRRLGSPRFGEASTLDSLGYIAHRDGRLTESLVHYDRALLLYQQTANAYQVADTLVDIGRVNEAAGHLPAARSAWERAIGLYRAQHRPAKADSVLKRLAELPDAAAGDHG
jgi:tetratricopeptide (TPR) repeat protein